jgi:hypothetical protein
VLSADEACGCRAVQGYCSAGVCQRFPIAVGEFGSKFAAGSLDLEWLSSWAAYTNLEGAAADGKHNK